MNGTVNAVISRPRDKHARQTVGAFFSWSGPRARFAETFWRRGGARALSTKLPLRLLRGAGAGKDSHRRGCMGVAGATAEDIPPLTCGA